MRNSIFEKYDFKAIGQAIKNARESKGITREELAEKLDLVARYLMSVENQGQHPSFQVFYELITMFDISVDQYIFPDKPVERTTRRRQLDSLLDRLLADKDEIIANFTSVQKTLFSTKSLEAEAKDLQNELAVVTELIQKCIDENASVALDQNEYQMRYNGLVERFDTAKARLDEAQALISDKRSRGKAMQAFIAELSGQDGLITDFDERLWYSLVDYATVYSVDDVRFTFKNGVEVRV